MKPLELVIHPKVPPIPTEPSAERLRWGNDRYRESYAGWQKRLTDAELAAEYWFMAHVVSEQRNLDVTAMRDVLEALADLDTIERFATHPHYDEVDA